MTSNKLKSPELVDSDLPLLQIAVASEEEMDKTKQKVFVDIDGMTCTNCSNTIENGLRNFGGVSSIKISLITNRAEIIFDSNQTTSAEICEEIEDLGFDAAATEVTDSKSFTLKVVDDLQPHTQTAVKTWLMGEEGITNVVADSQYIRVKFDPELTGIRDVFRFLQSKGVFTTIESDYGDLELRKSQMENARAAENLKWRNLFLISFGLTFPVFFIAMICPYIPAADEWLTVQVFPGCTRKSLILFCLSTPVQFGIGKRFYIGAYKSIRHHGANMDVLVAMGTSTAYFYSVLVLIMNYFYSKAGQELDVSNGDGQTFFETSSILITIIILGKYLEHRAKAKTSEALSKLMGLQALTATLLHVDEDGKVISEENVDSRLVQIRDVLKVPRGEKIPVDGIVVAGESSADESLVTGESMPVAKRAGSIVIGSTINLDNILRIKATNVGSDTVLSKIVRLVENAQGTKAPIQAFADKVAAHFVPSVLILAFLTWLTWYMVLSLSIDLQTKYVDSEHGTFVFSLLFAISVMVISCPCALGLATPTAVMVGTGLGAKHGILFKGGEPLEVAGRTKCIMFDKTGTLTQGKPVVKDAVFFEDDEKSGLREESSQMTKERCEFWRLVWSVESNSEHLLGKTIATFAQNIATESGASIHSVDPEDFEARTGSGVQAAVDGKQVAIGNRKWMKELDIQVSDVVDQQMHTLEERAETAVCVAIDGNVEAVLGIADAPKPEAQMVVQTLMDQGIQVWMVTGDNATTANQIASSLGIPEANVISEVEPAQKAAHVQKLKNTGTCVTFVGDGINDSPPLATADVGMAIGSGTDVAVASAHIVLLRDSLYDVLVAIDLSRAVLYRIRLNFLWALIYNVLSIPLAAGVFYPAWQKRVPPAVAGFAMALSSISVVLSSLYLKRYKPPQVDKTKEPWSVTKLLKRKKHYQYVSTVADDAGNSLELGNYAESETAKFSVISASDSDTSDDEQIV